MVSFPTYVEDCVAGCVSRRPFFGELKINGMVPHNQYRVADQIGVETSA
jgi:hypothetical protein